MDPAEVDINGANPFDRLPIEINQLIASYAECDRDLASYRLICRSTYDAVDGDNLTFWRRRFVAVFDRPLRSWDNTWYKKAYTTRRRFLRWDLRFNRGTSTAERRCLQILRDLALEAHGSSDGKAGSTSPSLNIEHLRCFVKNSSSFMDAGNWPEALKHWRYNQTRPINTLLLALQVLMAPCLLELDPVVELMYRFPDSQRAAYAHAEERPIFGRSGQEIDMEWLLHQLNFWQVHMTRKEEFTLFGEFSSLAPDELPRFWRTQLGRRSSITTSSSDSDGWALGQRWKGSYAFVDRGPLSMIRAGAGDTDVLQDEFNGESVGGVFQDLHLQPVSNEHVHWPAMFERHLRSLSQPVGATAPAQRTRAQHQSSHDDAASEAAGPRAQSFRFEGEGHDIDEDFLADGWVGAVRDQSGIPGWQRLTMMKYFLLDDNESIDEDALWAYEGVVLPGGQIVLGRWWNPNEGTGELMYSGPFILWCVDGE